MITYDRTKCISLNNQQCVTIPILTDFNPDKYNKWVHGYSFMVGLDRCNRSLILLMIQLVENAFQIKDCNVGIAERHFFD